MWILILAAVSAALLILYIKLYNRLKRLLVKVSEGSAGIDVALEKRFDLLSNELEAVKKYLEHEYGVYTRVTELRTGNELGKEAFEEKKNLSREAAKAINDTIAVQQKNMQAIREQLSRQQGEEAENGYGALAGQQISLDNKLGMLTSVWQELGGVKSAINALTEQYPALYSQASMQHFQRDIFDAEEHLQAARRLYNSNVSLYNQTISAFPYRIVAKLHGMKEAGFYSVEEKKKEFKVQF